MIRWLSAIALALALAISATVSGAQQLQLVQSALDALRRSAAALDHKDAGKAAEVLAGMKTSIETLSGTFSTFRTHAETAAKKREQELLGVIQQITRVFEAEQAAEKKLRELPGKIGLLEGSYKTLEAKRIDLNRQMAAYKEEVDFRNQCKSKFAEGIFWSTRCTALGFADLFEGRVSRLNSDIERNNRERGQIGGELSNLRRELQGAQATLQQAQRDKPRLEAERAQLQAKEGGLRQAVVNLNDAVLFWDDIRTLVDSRLSSPIGTLQDKASRLVRRTQQAGQAPAFSSYDIRKIATFRDTLIEFARTLDNQTNVLLLPENGGPPAMRRIGSVPQGAFRRRRSTTANFPRPNRAKTDTSPIQPARSGPITQCIQARRIQFGRTACKSAGVGRVRSSIPTRPRLYGADSCP
jgi:DNA repair exonuclease SbcCD ATPase subunit